ncbi:primosomal replication protein N [Aquisalimonas asiatica]|uniref:Replication restart protein PriB n=1 Tax=Aquisalimonas asiatica TaxID=406100 RepID=A0A1H8QZ76_9GAMM|nr:primosomal replication protein N [Aquisalimonas asiatica]SEO59386.1 restart primosome assembly protein PriB [Aquisalimonas asiatica]
MGSDTQPPWPDNRLALTGQLLDDPQTRMTPAGVPVSRFTLEHESGQPEAGQHREVRFRIAVHARGQALQDVIGRLRAGSPVRVLGYLGRSGHRPEQHRLVVFARRIQPLTNETQGVE